MKRTGRGLLDPNTTAALTFNVATGGNKHVAVGPVLTPIGDHSEGKGIPNGQTLYLFNSTNTVQYAALYEGTAPILGVHTAIPLPPGQYFILATGLKKMLKTSNAGVGVYQMFDETELLTNE